MYMSVLDITVNFMLNKRKSKQAAGASPQTPLGELSRRPPCCHVPPPVVNIFIRIYLSQNPGSAPGIIAFDFISKRVSSDVF